MRNGGIVHVFLEMLREEWRLHDRHFSGHRLTAFPVLIALVVGGGVWLLVDTGTAPETILGGLHLLVLLFGLHTGSIGFIGRDSLRNVLGELTLLVFSARTLPLARRRLLAVFVIKDVVYYGLLFMLPITIGAVPAVVALSGGSVLETTVGLWFTLTGMFVLGIGVTLASVGLIGRGISGAVLLVAGTAAVVVGWLLDVPLVSYTPYGVFLNPSLRTIGTSLFLLGAVLLVGATTFRAESATGARSARPSFRRWVDRLDDPIATKTLLDVHRSSGGIGKVLFSAGVLFVVALALVEFVESITGVQPAIGVSLGTILGFTAFTTYNWLTQLDDVEQYLAHPIDVPAVFRGKFRAFLVLGPLVGLAWYATGIVWRGALPLDALVGGIVLVGVSLYMFGLTVYLTGLSPNEFLFDTTLFAAFGVGMVVPLVPILVVAFVLVPLPAGWLVGVGMAAIFLGGLGVGLYRRAIPKWAAHHRR